MKLWLDYMMDRHMEDYILTKDSYGDWCAPPKTIEEGRGKNANVKYPSKLISTAFLYKFLFMMQDFAELTGNQEDIPQYQVIADSVKEAFNNDFFNESEAIYGEGKMTDNLLALAFNLVPENKKEEVLSSLEDIIMIENNGHLSVGLVGVQWLMRTLTENGMEEIAYKLATNTSYPSWGYMVENDATTIWELWNANTAAPQMNSQNHVMMLGDLIIWNYENLAGIKTSPIKTGFKEIIMDPIMPDDLDFVKASYESVYGKIISHWIKTDSTITWNIEIPANTSAKVYLPTQDKNAINESDKNIGDVVGINSISVVNNKLLLELGSGNYSFSIKRQ
jgi:alpha-L-rhamnosidase